MNLTVICIIALSLSAACIAVSAVFAAMLHYRRKNEVGRRKSNAVDKKQNKISRGAKYAFKPFHIVLAGVFLAATVIFYPIYFYGLSAAENVLFRICKSVLLSVHNALKMFTLNGEFSAVGDFFGTALVDGAVLAPLYSVYIAVLLVIAPAMTAGFILSFFKETSAVLRYALSRKADIYILSELNERSLALAEDILSQKKSGRRTVVFTDVVDTSEENMFELAEQAKRMGAVCMKKDVTKIGLKYTKKNIYRKIYLIGENEEENIRQAIAVINSCRDNERYNTEKTQIYVFSNSSESEVLLNTVDYGKLKVRRVNWSRGLAVDTIRKYSMFDVYKKVSPKKQNKQSESKESEIKDINIVIVGLGLYGTELLKAVLWCGQMPTYRLSVHVFDKRDDIESRIASFAPELIARNKKAETGEAYYNIEFHGGVDVADGKFLEILSKIENITMAFTTLGDDDRNIDTAVKIRMQTGRNGGDVVPPIYAVVSSVFKTRAAENGIKNFKKDVYGITFIGDTGSRYSLEIIEQEELERSAVKFHTAWVAKSDKSKIKEQEDAFNKYEYFRRSSIAQAVYAEHREKCGFKEREEKSEQDRAYNEMLKEYEHRRWNVFMRTEGYVYGKTKNDILKTHPDLVPYQKLSKEEKAKDSIKQ